MGEESVKYWVRIAIGMAAAMMVLAVTLGVAVILWFLWAPARPTAAEQHLQRHLVTLSRDRDQLLSLFRDARSLPKVEPAALPASLRVPGLLKALIHEDHITLITYHSPDTDSGFRVWKSAMGKGFADKPTAIPFVTGFSYCDDFPESPANRLE
jgi:hypothetical protein